MTEAEQQYEEIELSIEAARKNVDLGDALDRLYENKDFKAVIAEGFMEKEAVRLVHLKAHPAMQSAENQKKIDDNINAIGTLSQYFVGIDVSALQSKEAIESAEGELAEMAERGEL